MKMSDELSPGTFQRSFAEQDEFADAFLFNRADDVLGILSGIKKGCSSPFSGDHDQPRPWP
jgi:hypothetical protein